MNRSEKRAEAERDYASLVVKVTDRDALPVRAIPFVTGWTISPDVVAKNLARGEAAPFAKLANTDSYHLVDGRPVKLLPKEWDRHLAALQGLEAELRERFANDDRGYAAWMSQSVVKLPAGVFVWLDEFTADFERDYGKERLTILSERDGDRELSLAPFLEEDALNMALEGFERRRSLATHASDDSHAELVEFLQNGKPIDWRYWVENMPTLSPAEAARLMQGLDPELYEDLSSRPLPKYDATKPCGEARRMERLAAAEGLERLSPDGWYRWAIDRGFSVHRGFFLAGYGRYLKENEQAVLASMPRPEARRWEEAHRMESDQRQVTLAFAAHVSTVSQRFPDFCAEVEERLARWRRGRYTLIEAAQVIADLRADLDATLLSEQMDAAIHAGKLTYRLNNIRVGPQFIPQKHLWHRDVFEHDVNAWLAEESIGTDVRLAYPYADTSSSLQNPDGADKNAEFRNVDWYDATLNACDWWVLSDIQPREAATLLCQQDPHSNPNPEELTTSETNPLDFRKLLRAFEDAAKRHPKSRTLEDWRKLAKELGLKYHSWIDEYSNSVRDAQLAGGAPETKVTYHLVMHQLLRPRTEWKGGRLTHTDTVTLEEAAQFASRQAGQEITIADFLRAASRGEIRLRAIAPRDAHTRPCVPGDELLNQGQPVPKDSIPTLPIDACLSLANVGRASWRNFESGAAINGLPHRFSRWELASAEPDFVTTLADCRVTGDDVHALADAFTDDKQETRAAPNDAARKHKVQNRSDPLAAVIKAAKETAVNGDDYQSVWAALVKMAETNPPAPVVGYVPGEGVQYKVDDESGELRYFKKDALRKRMNPSARGG